MDQKSTAIAAVLAGLLAVSEYLGITDKFKQNSIVQVIGSFFCKIFGVK